MATQSTSVSVNATFTLTDQNGTVVFTFSPSFASTSNTSSQAITAGQVLAGTSDDTINIALHNKDRIFALIKNVDTDYAISVKPDGDIIADLKPGEGMFAPIDIDGAGDSSVNLDLDAATAAQKAEFVLCDALDA